MACIGVVALSLVEANEDDDLRKARQQASNYKYAKSWMALALPIAYCLLDAAGTFADALVLDKLGEGMADSCNVAYELTFLFAGAVSLVYLLVVKRPSSRRNWNCPSIWVPSVRLWVSCSISMLFPTRNTSSWRAPIISLLLCRQCAVAGCS